MKFRWDKKYLYWGLTLFLVITASISFFLALYSFKEVSGLFSTFLKIVRPVLYGLVIGYLLTPVMTFFERYIMRGLLYLREKNSAKDVKVKEVKVKHKYLKAKPKRRHKINIGKWSRALAIVLTLVVSGMFLTGLFSMVLPQVVTSILGISDNIDTYGATLQNMLMSILDDNPQLEEIALRLYNNFSDYLNNWVQNEFLPQVNNIVSDVTNGVIDMLVVLKDLLIGIIISVYVMASKDIFSAQAKKIVFAIMKPERANEIIATVRKTHRVFGGFISGKLLDSLIIGILCFICMNLMDMPYTPLVSVIIGVTNIIPFFGPFIGAIPGGLLILLVDPVKCIYFVIFILLLQQFDGNILGPKILGDSTGLSSFWVMFAILVAGGLFGFIGMIIGIPFFAVIYSLISDAVSKALKEKNLPTKTSEYKNLKYIDDKTLDLVHQKYTMVNKVDKIDSETMKEKENEKEFVRVWKARKESSKFIEIEEIEETNEEVTKDSE